MIHEGTCTALITSANITRIDATSHSGRMLMKALCSSLQNTNTAHVAWFGFVSQTVHGVTHHGIDLDRNQIELNLDPRVWVLRGCLSHPQLLAATASTHPQFTFLLPFQPVPRHRHPSPSTPPPNSGGSVPPHSDPVAQPPLLWHWPPATPNASQKPRHVPRQLRVLRTPACATHVAEHIGGVFEHGGACGVDSGDRWRAV